MEGAQPYEGHLYTQITDGLMDENGRGWMEYHALMIVWQDGIAERAHLERIIKAALKDACAGMLEEKENLLG